MSVVLTEGSKANETELEVLAGRRCGGGGPVVRGASGGRLFWFVSRLWLGRWLGGLLWLLLLLLFTLLHHDRLLWLIRL